MDGYRGFTDASKRQSYCASTHMAKEAGAKRVLDLEGDPMRTAELVQAPFMQAGEVWLESRRPFLASRTLVDYANYLQILNKSFGEFKLTEITSDQLRAYQRMRRDSVSALKINQELGLLSMMLKRIGRWQDLAGDYQRLKVRRESPGRALSPAEHERLFRHAMSKKQWEMAYLFAIISVNTTAGPKEIWTLRLEDYDREERIIYIRGNLDARGMREGGKNQNRCRTIPLNDLAFAAAERVFELAKRRGSHKPWHYLFPFRIKGNAYGGFYDPERHCTTCKTAWIKLRIAANLPGIRPYDMRHTAITSLLQNPKVSDETARSISGHISDVMFKTYSHSRIDVKRAALDALVGNSLTGKGK